MEHQVTPRGSSYDDEGAIPYTGSMDYLNVPFLDYPGRVGYTFLRTDNSKTWVDYGQVEIRNLSAKFLQTWLFCGLLQEFLGRSLETLTGRSLYQHEDFVRMRNDVPISPEQRLQDQTSRSESPVRLYVTTAKLSPLLEEWSRTVESKIDDAEGMCVQLSHCIVAIVRPVKEAMKSNLEYRSMQSICSVTELLGLVLERVFSKQTYAKDNPCIPSFEDVLWDKSSVDYMMARGWCEFQANDLISNYHFLQALLYLKKLEKPKIPMYENRHSNCDKSQCRGLLAPDEPQHRQVDCQCEDVRVGAHDWTYLKQILKSNKVPILRFSDTKGMIEINVVSSDPTLRYTALSHVWADGLGNRKHNSLYRCQIDHIYRRLAALDRKLGNNNTAFYVWIDTICCPLEPDAYIHAMSLMKETYLHAANVLVLDAELEITDLSDLDPNEIMARISCSSWMRRLWTFQEAALAKNLWVQFRAESLDLDRFLKTHNGDDSRIQARMLHRLLKNKLLGISRNRMLMPQDRQQKAHIIGYGIQDRSVSVSSDEPLCLSTLFDLEVAKVAEKPPLERMQEVWRLLSETDLQIPLPLLFSSSPRLTTPGYRWAPSTIINTDTPALLFIQTGMGRLQPEGLQVKLPGVLLSPIKAAEGRTISEPNLLADRPTYFRDNNGSWYVFSVEDNHEAQRIADKENMSFPEALMKTPCAIKNDLPNGYSTYAIVGSQSRNGNITACSRAILVSSRGRSGDGTILANRVYRVGVPCAVNPRLSEILEAAFQYTNDETTSEDQNERPPPGTGNRILEQNPNLHERLVFSSNPAAYLENFIYLMRRGRVVAHGELLDSTQQWCID